MEECECGHEAPVGFIQYDSEGCGTCMPCHIEFLEDLLKKSKARNKKLRQKLKPCCQGNKPNGSVELCKKCLEHYSQFPC